jgi:hypothetical protein
VVLEARRSSGSGRKTRLDRTFDSGIMVCMEQDGN